MREDYARYQFKIDLAMTKGLRFTVRIFYTSKLKHYNKILKDQLVELEQEILRVEGGFRAQFGISLFADLSPNTIMRDLASEIVGVQQAIRDMKEDLLAFEDVKKVKAWLKDLRHQPRVVDFNDPLF